MTLQICSSARSTVERPLGLVLGTGAPSISMGMHGHSTAASVKLSVVLQQDLLRRMYGEEKGSKLSKWLVIQLAAELVHSHLLKIHVGGLLPTPLSLTPRTEARQPWYILAARSGTGSWDHPTKQESLCEWREGG